MRERVVAALLVVFSAQSLAQQSITFWNVSIIDIDAAAVRAGMAVEIAKGRITRVAPAVGAKPQNTTVIDATGKFLMPGLWDAHVHLTKLGASSLSLFLANGVTSVRDMGSDLAQVLRWRREVESGTRPGPRIRTPGQILESRANVERMMREATVELVDRIRISVGTPEEAHLAVARLASSGADFVKVRTVADVTVFRAIAAAARDHGLKLTGHPVAPPDVLLEARMASVEHLLAFPPLESPREQRRALFQRLRDGGVRMGMTTVNLEYSLFIPYESAVVRLRTDPQRRYVPRPLAADWTEQVEERKGPEGAVAAHVKPRKSGPTRF